MQKKSYPIEKFQIENESDNEKGVKTAKSANLRLLLKSSVIARSGESYICLSIHPADPAKAT
jgi:hypothetical protein